MTEPEFDTSRFVREVESAVGGIDGYIRRHAENRSSDLDGSGSELRGPHPVHGSTSEQGNIVVDTDQGVWHCKRRGHQEGSGGGILEYIAVDHGIVDCACSATISGADWTDTLEVAADVAGVELNIDAGDKPAMRERREKRTALDETMAAANEWFREQLTDEVRDILRDRYGFSEKTIAKAGIGYAPADERAMIEAVDASEPELLEAGLAVERNGKIVSFYQGRITFPYRENGNIRYFIGRETPETPDWENAKYKKPRRPADENPISELVTEPVFGVDSIRGENDIVVTEGITDAIALHDAGVAAIAPVTTQFKKDRVDDVAHSCRGKNVTVVMDEDPDSDAGLLGAVKTAHVLAESGKPASVSHARLPGEDVDVAEYMRSHTAAEFEESVLQSSVPSEVAWWAHGDGDPAGLLAAAMRKNDHSPWCAATKKDDDGDPVPMHVDEIVTSEDIGNAIQQFRSRADELDGKEKNRCLVNVVWWYLITSGDFFRTSDGTVYYYHGGEAHVYRVSPDGQREVHQDFHALLTTSLGLLADRTARNVFSFLRDRASREAPERDAHRFAYYNRDEGVLYVSDFGDGYYALDGNRVDHRRNGTDVFFLPDDFADEYEYVPELERAPPDSVLGELDKNRAYMANGDMVERVICNRVNFDRHCPLGVSLQHRQLYLHLHSLPFGSLLTGRPIASFIGEKGSGKTVIMRSVGQFLFGPEWHESVWPEDKQDFVAKVTNNSLAFFDNYDDGVSWANDALASVATGTGMEMRELYTTNELRRVRPDCWIGITSRTPPYRRDDVADRTLVHRLERVEGDKVGMGEFLNVVSAWRDLMWSDYLDNLNEVVAHMNEVNRDEYTSEHRMADWAIQAQIIAEALDIGLTDADGKDLFGAISEERAAFALEDKPALRRSIEAALSERAIRGLPMTASELFEELKVGAQEANVSLDHYSPQRLGTDLSKYETELDEVYGFTVDRDNRENLYRFTEDTTQQSML